jgi:arylsulfatase A-like enzyme
MLPTAWCLRAARFGALVGAALAVAGQGLVALVDATPHELPWIDRAAAVVIEASLVGIAALCAATITRRLAMAPSLGLRRLAVLLATLIVAPIVAAQVLGFVLRGLCGSPLTMGGVDFFLGSAQHIARALFERYAAYTGGALVMALAFTGMLALGLRGAATDAPAPRRAEAAGLAFIVGAFLLSLVARPASAVERVAQASPAVAFFSSLAAANASDDEGPPEVEALARAALDSPPQLAGAVWRKAAPAAPGPRPNVVLLMLESVGTNHLGYFGYERDTTPNLDRIAIDSRRFSRVWSTATHSNYAQMAVLSSLFPRRSPALDMYQRLDYPRYLLHDVAHELGYVTGTISSQDETWQGMLRFQQSGAHDYYFHALDHEGDHLDTGTERIVPDEVTVAHALSWIDQAEKKGPFSLYVNLQSTHWPYPIPDDAPRHYGPLGMKKPASYASWSRDDFDAIVNRYDNALSYVDAQVGELVDGLEERGILDDTILIVTADHGELFHEHGLVTHGRSLYENEARVPLLVRYPRTIAPGEDDRMASTIDVLPTLLDALELPPYPGHQGESLLAREDAAAAREDTAAGAQRAPRAIFLNMQGWRHAEGVVCWPWKLVVEGSAARLYDLERDPGELVDRTDEAPQIASDLGTVLRAQMAAQMRYHAADNGHRLERFAPQLLRCPAITPPPHVAL